MRSNVARGDFNREGLGIEVDFSLPAERVIRSLNRIIEWRGKPETIRVPSRDHAAHNPAGQWIIALNISVASCWNGLRNKVLPSSTSNPGKPQQNAYIERYDRTVRHEWLDQHIIETIEEAQDFATQWLWTYNNDRPNMGIGGITPAQKLKMAA